MGAYSLLRVFDFARYHREVAPAIRGALRDELDIDLARDCHWLDDDLAPRVPYTYDHREALISHRDGTCLSQRCPVRGRCPLHRSQTGPMSAEAFQDRAQAMIEATCYGEQLLLGRHGDINALLDGVALRRGVVLHGGLWFAHPWPFEDDDAVVGALLRLTMRGSAIGWGDGGFGEGLRGWLDPDETARLAGDLDALPPPPDAAADLLAATHGFLHRARALDRGVVLTRH